MAATNKVPLDNYLIPKHEILPNGDEEKTFSAFGITKANLPKIKLTDPQVKALEAKVGDILKITRKDKTGESTHYRIVIK
jgi:DNA-directed RNA polymerase subunit H